MEYMKYILLTLLPVLLHSATIPKSILDARYKLAQIWDLKNVDLSRPAPEFKFRDRKQLTKYVYKVAKFYNLQPRLLIQIVAVESNYCKYRVNKATSDFGCFQLNAGTIKLHKWNVDAVIKNDMLNTVAAAIILRDFKRAFIVSEPNTFVCRYNTGYRHLPATCAKYMQKLAAVK